jgi:hypothetical protein
MRYWTLLDWTALVLIVGGLIGLSVLAAIADRRARARSAAAWRDYVKGGGVVRRLIARWRGPPMLTDERDERR